MTEERIRIIDQNARQPIVPQLVIDFKETPNQIGQFAMQLVAISMHTAKHVSNRINYQEMVPLDPAEVATRCCDVAEAVFEELRKRKLMVPVPPYEEMRKKLEAEGSGTTTGFKP